MNEVKLQLVRRVRTDNSTSGDLYVDDKFFCYVLEDKDRELNQSMNLNEIKTKKVFAKTCIPYGSYEVKMTKSTRFQKLMPQIMNVPGFEGVRIHAGNFPKDTEGCLLVGSMLAKDEVRNSKPVFAKLMELLGTADKITIDIVKV